MAARVSIMGWHLNGITSTGALKAAEGSSNVDSNFSLLVAKPRAYSHK